MYLLGNLDRSYLTTLGARGGLQSYPSRTKDPDRVDGEPRGQHIELGISEMNLFLLLGQRGLDAFLYGVTLAPEGGAHSPPSPPAWGWNCRA
ncbi:hypothetical protein [Micromonospora craniellae]|uniref:hypothetical protein n=1 Tax=Micromonospora craniellae TaxID=2294034 RepID=UPI0026845038